jgi:hypothetical protein
MLENHGQNTSGFVGVQNLFREPSILQRKGNTFSGSVKYRVA